MLEPGARIVVNDAVIPAPGTLPCIQEARLRNIDLSMLALQNAGEFFLIEDALSFSYLFVVWA